MCCYDSTVIFEGFPIQEDGQGVAKAFNFASEVTEASRSRVLTVFLSPQFMGKWKGFAS
jgi:hypothetical protein